MVTDAMIERFARAMFDVWPLLAVSRALVEQSGQEVGSALTYDKVLEMGGNHDGLLRLASGAAALHAEIERELATRPTADLGDDGELVARLTASVAPFEQMDGRRPADLTTVDDVRAARDRLILYREALEAARQALIDTDYYPQEVIDKIDAVLSRSGGSPV